jgi:hypothetical protein
MRSTSQHMALQDRLQSSAGRRSRYVTHFSSALLRCGLDRRAFRSAWVTSAGEVDR